MKASFGYWLAGLIDGEGCFRIHGKKDCTYFACHFSLKLRDDDLPILEKIVSETKIGYIRPDKSKRTNPCAIWYVNTKEGTLKLLRLLDKYPLQSRKARDFRIWRKAVLHWLVLRRGNKWQGPTNWEKMIKFKKDVENIRKYVPPSSPITKVATILKKIQSQGRTVCCLDCNKKRHYPRSIVVNYRGDLDKYRCRKCYNKHRKPSSKN